MIVYKCLISGDEIFTDSFDFKEENGFYVLKGKLITKKADDVDAAALGANPSAEEQEEETEGGTESGIDIVLASRLVETGFDKKAFRDSLKALVKTVIKKLGDTLSDEEIVKAKSDLTAAYEYATANFKEWDFYTGESMDAFGLVALVKWVDEEENGQQVSTPYFYAMKWAITACKY